MAATGPEHIHVYVVEGTVLDPETGAIFTTAKCNACPAVKTVTDP